MLFFLLFVKLISLLSNYSVLVQLVFSGRYDSYTCVGLHECILRFTAIIFLFFLYLQFFIPKIMILANITESKLDVDTICVLFFGSVYLTHSRQILISIDRMDFSLCMKSLEDVYYKINLIFSLCRACA